MNFYRAINQLRTTELTVVRRGFWTPEYFLTDGQFEYGRLSEFSFSSTENFIESGNGLIKLVKATALSRHTLIWSNGQVIGKATRRKWAYEVDMELNNGFAATFVRMPDRSFFSKNLSWVNSDGELIRISGGFGFSRSMAISIVNAKLLHDADHLLLMVFLGLIIKMTKETRNIAR